MSTIVTTTCGKLEGEALSNQTVFRGIPFAAPPVGELRWRSPQPVASWSGVRPATEFGNAAFQTPLENITPWPFEATVSEDCLYLNVWTPAADGARRPVMVWIHGGAFQFGSGDEMMRKEPTLVTRGDIVLVTVNYRLGPWGFMNLNEVTGGAIPSTGNEGLLDQVAALEWVRDNIEAFGGDPENVTIFGESAGGMSVGCLLAMPAAAGLFHKAIPQSGACHTANTPDRIAKIGERIARLAGGDDAAHFLAMTTEEILAIQAGLGGEGAQGEDAWQTDTEVGSQPLGPCIDGTVIPELPYHLVQAGKASFVPLLVGTTLDEYKGFVYAEPSLENMTDDDTRSLQGHMPGLDEIMKTYREAFAKRGAPHAPRDIFAAIGSDKQFRIPAVRLAEAYSAHDPRVYNYLYTWPSPVMDGQMGATHTIELGPLFDICEVDEAHRAFFGSGPEAARMTEQTQLCWTAFARTGNPSHEGVGDWPTYDVSTRATMMLGEECQVENAPYDEERKAWDAVPDEFIGEY